MARVKCEDLCPEWPCEQPEEFKGVWVVGEVDEQGLKEASLQLLTPAKRIAAKLGSEVTGVLIGSGVKVHAEEMIKYGADTVIVVDDERLKEYYPNVYGHVIAELAKKYKPEVILIAGTLRGREMAPYVANTLRTGITADCTDFDIDEKTRDLLLIRPPFAAIMLAYIRTPHRRPQIGTARPNVFPLPQRDESRRGKVIFESIGELPEPGMKLVSRRRLKRVEVPVEKAEIIVSGGRGVGGPEGFKLLEELARELNAVVAGSRKAVDAGWIPPDRQIGLTGKSVKPVVYIAVGISGAAQHMIGVREAGRIVAINIDPEAPIFNQADYGIIGDYREVVRALIEEIRRIKSEGLKALKA